VHHKQEDYMKKIFIIDDDESVLFLSKAILSADKYSVVSESDSSKVFEAIVAEAPDLILTDIIMPDVNGAELAYQLKNDERTSSIPVIAVSGHPLIDDKTRELFVDVIKKPYKTEALLNRIHELIGH